MKIMEKAKRFFTLNAAKHEGFTLVELIVVIAILAILAGVAVPAYSGYIEKSKRAGDETLLAAVNKAFAAACLDAGTEVYLLNPSDGTPTILLKDDKSVDMDKVSPFKDEFALYFEGNTTSQFQVIQSLTFDWGTYMFIDPANAPGGVITVSYGGNTLTLPSATVVAMQNSTYGQEMGATVLLDEVSGLAGFIAEDSLLADDDYMRAYADYLNIDVPANLTGDDLLEHIENALDAKGWTSEQKEGALANGAVIYAADRIQDKTFDQMETILTSGNIYDNLTPNSQDEGLRLAEAAMAYGMYAAFVHSDYNKNDAELATNNPMGALQAISRQDDENYKNFQDYITSDQGKADMEAYMSAMTLINDSKGNDATVSVLQNGFSDSELESLLSQVLGK